MSPNIWPQVLERQLVLTCLGWKAELDRSSKLVNVHPLGGGGEATNIENEALEMMCFFGPNVSNTKIKGEVK